MAEFERRAHNRYPFKGFIQRSFSKRAKSLSQEMSTDPLPIASAARSASVVRLPAVPASSSRDLRMLQCASDSWSILVFHGLLPVSEVGPVGGFQ